MPGIWLADVPVKPFRQDERRQAYGWDRWIMSSSLRKAAAVTISVRVIIAIASILITGPSDNDDLEDFRYKPYKKFICGDRGFLFR